MTTFRMEAKENYPSDIVTYLEANEDFANYTFTDQLLQGVNFDAVRRKLCWGAMIWVGTDPTATNTSGLKLWDGVELIDVAADYDQSLKHSLYIFEKDIDTEVVTSWNTWSATKLVPNGIGGSNGTDTARFVTDLDQDTNWPITPDPRTGNKWVHTESCFLYLIRLSDGYAQAISPLRPTQDPNNALLTVGMSEDWVFIYESGGSSTPGDPTPFYITPRLITAAETAADELLIYATYDLPGVPETASTHNYFRFVVDPDGALWYFANEGGSGLTVANYKLWKFTPPTLGAYPATGGAWEDKTPWSGSTGPNTTVGVTSHFTADAFDRNIAMALRDTPHLVLLSQHINGADYRLDCTYYDRDAATFTFHEEIVSRYMTADWVPTADPDAATYCVDNNAPTIQINEYLNQHDYDFGADYARRWLWFRVLPVVDGVVGASQRFVMVEYEFNPTGVPTIARLLDEATTWDPAYTDYAAAIGRDAVVNTSVASQEIGFEQGRDKGIFDPTGNAFWFSGDTDGLPSGTPMFYLDAAFTPRADFDPVVSPPLLKLSWTPPRRRQVLVRSYVGAPNS